MVRWSEIAGSPHLHRKLLIITHMSEVKESPVCLWPRVRLPTSSDHLVTFCEDDIFSFSKISFIIRRYYRTRIADCGSKIFWSVHKMKNEIFNLTMKKISILTLSFFLFQFSLWILPSIEILSHQIVTTSPTCTDGSGGSPPCWWTEKIPTLTRS